MVLAKEAFPKKIWQENTFERDFVSHKFVDCKKYSFIGKVIPYNALSCKFRKGIRRAIL